MHWLLRCRLVTDVRWKDRSAIQLVVDCRGAVREPPLRERLRVEVVENLIRAESAGEVSHFDGRYGSFVTLVTAFEAGAV